MTPLPHPTSHSWKLGQGITTPSGNFLRVTLAAKTGGEWCKKMGICSKCFVWKTPCAHSKDLDAESNMNGKRRAYKEIQKQAQKTKYNF